MRFAIFTHVEHVPKERSYFAYAPYIREMNLWLHLVEKVEVVAPLRKEMNYTAEAYLHDHLVFTSIPDFNLLNPKNALGAILKFPVIFARTLAAMNRADHLHLRCPGNVGLIACICQIFFPKKPKTAKYAGNWDPAAKQPWSYRLQKWILKNPFLTRNIQVLVYGDWPGQTKNIKPFFTASFFETVIKEVREKNFQAPFTFLFVGNLVAGKQPVEAIRLVQGLKDSGAAVSLEIYGSGPERVKLENYCLENDLQDNVQFFGKRSLEELKAAYQKAHFVVLPSRSEGWPKALAEGMFFGCIPIATPVSCVPWMLGNGSRGVLLSESLLDTLQKSRQFECPDEYWDGSRTGFSETRKEKEVFSGQWTEDLNKISRLMANPIEMLRMSEAAKEWSQQYTLEKFEEGIREVLSVSGRKNSVETGKHSPAPFRACPDTSGDGVKRGKN